ncbi:hypothetical protein AURANDRAFT_28848 [Aureococcus anophagefferens]|uniref:Cilia- and flagella-associated protein 52 n=1 Tax=Aureococcus anophagefferens TaxID=44056 RepID=F0YDJ7_AURAN|nr:hypothetical protein AURANDRAFT_28848 [Aureococcus anophagefferens]EGB06785.1 hypothetical protein AURANDRAFT_28848 [Aureococcus anophagefferens]|eukprot:XP_009038533.1 hypothetical protein AURANDRAFT_28848 [Aureococcus anophagefferens]
MPPNEDIAALHPSSCLGFSGGVLGGLHAVSYRGEPFITFPLGAMVVVKHATRKEGVAFLQGHSRSVSCVAVSHDCRMLASGQTNQLGVEAPVMLWDLEEACERVLQGGAGHGSLGPVHVLRQHLAGVQALSFSCDDRSLATIGGRDDNSLVIWDTRTGNAICGVPAAPDTVLCVSWLKRNPHRLVTAGKYHVRVWHVDPSGPKIHPMDAKMGKMKRVVQCVDVSADDDYAMCGTQTGEVLQIDVNRDPILAYNDPDRMVPRLVNTSKDRFGKGVKSICVMPGASADGLDVRWTAQVSGGVTSLSALPDNPRALAIGTDLANRYEIQDLGREPFLKGTAHTGAVFDVCFPEYSSQVFITCSVADIRVWDAAKRAELLRIQVPNLECKCVGVTAVGDVVVTGWSDGKVRAFGPESGKLKFAIPDAHAEAVTALALCKEGGCVQTRSGAPWRLLTGGVDGRVRVWKITHSHQALLNSMKEHRSAVTCIRITTERDQCISSSKDGACLVWCLERYVRLTALFEPTLFNSVLYHPDSSQILTCGSNMKISYWEASSGDAIRVVKGGDGEMTALAISDNGKYFVSGSADKSVKLWDYDGGIFLAKGVAHSGTVSAATISPDQRTVVSVGHEGGIFVWPLPEEIASDM